jgi:polyhydroxyalkanoate synthesis regulator phasin
MDEMIKKAVNLGLGAFVLTREKVEALVEELIEKGELGKDEGKELFDKLLAKGDEARKNVEKTVKEFVDELELPSRKEFDSLKSDVEKLKKQAKS